MQCIKTENTVPIIKSYQAIERQRKYNVPGEGSKKEESTPSRDKLLSPSPLRAVAIMGKDPGKTLIVFPVCPSENSIRSGLASSREV